MEPALKDCGTCEGSGTYQSFYGAQTCGCRLGLGPGPKRYKNKAEGREDGMNIEDIALELDMTKQGVFKAEQRALAKLRTALLAVEMHEAGASRGRILATCLEALSENRYWSPSRDTLADYLNNIYCVYEIEPKR